MPRRKANKRSESDGVRALPWTAMLQLGVLAANRWQRLTATERKRLRALLRASRGRISNLTMRERVELRKLTAKLDLKDAGAQVLRVISIHGRRPKR